MIPDLKISLHLHAALRRSVLKHVLKAATGRHGWHAKIRIRTSANDGEILHHGFIGMSRVGTRI